MSICLPYLSEFLFTEMVNRERNAILPLLALDGGADPEFVKSTPELATRDVRLAPIGGLRFDGASRVDVIVRYQAGMAVAVELKLGTTRLSKTRIDEEWLAPCSPSHNGRRWKGNMMAVLERRFDRPVNEDLVATTNGERLALAPRWVLVARREILAKWKTSPPEFSSNVARLAFEDVVTAFGGPEPFNRLVRQLLSVDFYSEWVLGNGGIG